MRETRKLNLWFTTFSRAFGGCSLYGLAACFSHNRFKWKLFRWFLWKLFSPDSLNHTPMRNRHQNLNSLEQQVDWLTVSHKLFLINCVQTVYNIHSIVHLWLLLQANVIRLFSYSHNWRKAQTLSSKWMQIAPRTEAQLAPWSPPDLCSG